MEHPLTVFISSVIAGLADERRAAQSAIQAIPLTRAWLFEFSPASSLPLAESYLSKVRGCDVFVLLLGDKITDPVKAEVAAAQAAGKPRLIFLAAAAPADVVAYAQSLGVKYAGFADADQLAAQVAEAVGDELIRGYREHQVTRADLPPIIEFLEKLAQTRQRIEVGGVLIEGDVQGDLTIEGDGKRVTHAGVYIENQTVHTATPPRRSRPGYAARLLPELCLRGHAATGAGGH